MQKKWVNLIKNVIAYKITFKSYNLNLKFLFDMISLHCYYFNGNKDIHQIDFPW